MSTKLICLIMSWGQRWIRHELNSFASRRPFLFLRDSISTDNKDREIDFWHESCVTLTRWHIVTWVDVIIMLGKITWHSNHWTKASPNDVRSNCSDQLGSSVDFNYLYNLLCIYVQTWRFITALTIISMPKFWSVKAVQEVEDWHFLSHAWDYASDYTPFGRCWVIGWATSTVSQHVLWQCKQVGTQ